MDKFRQGAAQRFSWFRLHRTGVLLTAVAVLFSGLMLGGVSEARRRPPSTTTTTVAQVPGDPQPSFPIKASFFYPWFPEGWNQQGYNPFTQYNPTKGFYDSSSAAVISQQIAEMQYAGMDAGISSWWGQGTKSDSRVNSLLSASSSFRWALYYEQESTGNPTVTQLQSDLSYIDSKYGTQTSYLRVGGRPVIFAFADGSDSCSMVDRWKQANANKRFYVVLKVFSGYRNCSSQPDSWHQYGPAAATDSQSGYSYSISPGFWKKGETSPRLVRDQARWASNIASMKASNAPWQLVTSFNEWGEGTSIEPALEWASDSGYGVYIDALHAVYGSSSGTTTTAVNPTTTTNIVTTTQPPLTTTIAPVTTTQPPVTTTVAPSGGVCGNPGTPKARQKVVIFSFENRTFSQVGASQFQNMPYFNSLAKQCATFSNYTEPNTAQNSATQYVGAITGSTANTVLNDCSPSASCNSTSDNVFRQARTAGLTAVNYVEGATSGCSASGNAAKHVPYLYMYGADDRSFCSTHVRPYSEFNPNSLPDFSFVTPTLCNDGHDCSNATVDFWASTNVQAVLNSAAYQNGDVSVFIWYDEDKPTPNMQIGKNVTAGVRSTAIGYGSFLRAWEDLLGVPNINAANGATDIRPLINL